MDIEEERFTALTIPSGYSEEGYRLALLAEAGATEYGQALLFTIKRLYQEWTKDMDEKGKVSDAEPKKDYRYFQGGRDFARSIFQELADAKQMLEQAEKQKFESREDRINI